MTDYRTQWLIDNETYVKRVIYDCGVNTNDVDDLYQQILMTSLSRKFQPGKHNAHELKYFSIQFVKWICHNYRVHRGRDRLLFVGQPFTTTEESVDFNFKEAENLHYRLFWSLSWENRYVLESFLDGKTQEEIGISMGISRSAVWCRLNTIRRRASDLADILDKK